MIDDRRKEGTKSGKPDLKRTTNERKEKTIKIRRSRGVEQEAVQEANLVVKVLPIEVLRLLALEASCSGRLSGV